MYLLGTKLKGLHIKFLIPSTLVFVYCQPKFSLCGGNSDLIYYMYVEITESMFGCDQFVEVVNSYVLVATCS